MTSAVHLKRQDLVFPELSYKIIGILFDVFNELGPGFQEKYYQRAIAIRLRELRVPFKQLIRVNLKFQGKLIGHYVLDFIIDDRIVVELKRGNRLLKRHIEQLYGYLRATKRKLGLLVTFTSSGVRFKRIVNLF